MRRFSPSWRLGITLWLLVSWSWVCLRPDSRAVLQQHLRAATVPHNVDYSFDLAPSKSVEWQMVNEQHESKPASFRALVEANPQNATLLAVYLRHNRVLPFSNTHSKGPLDSPFPDWSVRIKADSTSSLGPLSPLDVAPVPEPEPDLRDFLMLARRGQKLEPQNTYFDWMEMTALVASGRPFELDAIATKAACKSDFDDHGVDELRARIAYYSRQQPLFEPATKTYAFSGQLLPHLSPIRKVSRSLAQRVMGLRLQKRDDEALALGLSTMRLARLVRLNAAMPMISQVGLACEAIAMRSARVPLGPRLKYNVQLNPSFLAGDPESLLFLAKARSPQAAREIAGEWAQLGRWNVLVLKSPEVFGGFVKTRAIEGVGWTTRAASYLMVSLPVCGLVWLVLTAWSLWRRDKKQVAVSPRLPMWGALLGLGLPGAFIGFEWINRAIVLRDNPTPGSFCGTGMVAREEILFPQGSFLGVAPSIWGAVSLWLGIVAFRAAFALPRRAKEISNSNRSEIELSPTHPVEMLWKVVSGAWKGAGGLLRLSAPLIAGAVVAAPFGWPGSDREALWSIRNLFAVGISLALWAVVVWIGEVGTFARSRRRAFAPAGFVVRWRALLGGFLLATLCVLPPLLLAQTVFTREFNREFAPVEAGQMVEKMFKPLVAPPEVGGCL